LRAKEVNGEGKELFMPISGLLLMMKSMPFEKYLPWREVPGSLVKGDLS
jgi:hypothetical protein